MPHRLVQPLKEILEERGIVLSAPALKDVALRTANFAMAYAKPAEAAPPMINKRLKEMSKIQRFVFGASALENHPKSEFLGHQTDQVYFLFSGRMIHTGERALTLIDPSKTYAVLAKLCMKRPDATYDFENIRKMIPRSAREIKEHPYLGISIEERSSQVWCMSAPEPDDSYSVWLPTPAMAILRSLFDREVYIRGMKHGVAFYTRWLAAYVKNVEELS